MQPNEASPQQPPIEPDEFLLRRFPNETGLFDFVLGNATYSAFLPNRNDQDGLSLNRETRGSSDGFLTPEEHLAKAGTENFRNTGGEAAIPVSDVISAGMTVVIDDDPDSPGHVLIPELNRADYDAKSPSGEKPGKQRIKLLADELAR